MKNCAESEREREAASEGALERERESVRERERERVSGNLLVLMIGVASIAAGLLATGHPWLSVNLPRPPSVRLPGECAQIDGASVCGPNSDSNGRLGILVSFAARGGNHRYTYGPGADPSGIFYPTTRETLWYRSTRLYKRSLKPQPPQYSLGALSQ